MLTILLTGCALRVAPPPAAPTSAGAITDRIDWTEAREEAAVLLSNYIMIDTINPPGNELNGAEYLSGVLTAEGIPYEIDEFLPGRANLIARLEGQGDDPPLCLLSHSDVVTAEADKWDADRQPLSGVRMDGYVWGRGALDMKGMGIVELLTMAWLKRLDVPLNRDIILLVVADEEVDGLGIQRAVETWDDIGCSHVINEGGLGLIDMLFEGQTVYPISVGEKGNVWLRMVARGSPGHGSTPRPGEAPAQIIDAVNALNDRKLDPEISGALLEFLASVGKDEGGFSGFVMQRPPLVNMLVKPQLLDNPLTRAAMINTVHLTGFSSGTHSPNVVPSEVSAILDCRIQPGVTADEAIAAIQEIVGPDIELEVINAREGNLSTWDDPLYQAIVRQVQAEGHVAGPVVSVGFTDSIFLRPLGVQAYGFVPFELTEEEMGTFHGNRERVSEENLERGVRMLLSTVIEFAASSANPPTPAGVSQ
ncbi:MAG: acetylornithine deacetylase/succinyl-diaminopimelate desuccinylase-like protein [Myxococcota bacterium]|jgi:acetylornithine deacetylase/succinyl-diaminopimelate desuccinylase-like protein